ncbi:hypothetical protein PHJA_002877100 [Phtheirospermum japonicum]|uniref:Uncharacterized protein n=1 Tax=Phtheirospermum japonicum TaxID=374723 RepID=A0A830D7W2_9LAMI|nr:hypothetical protein PHJA_002877100 [Phtheirospermum japonicum]
MRDESPNSKKRKVERGVDISPPTNVIAHEHNNNFGPYATRVRTSVPDVPNGNNQNIAPNVPDELNNNKKDDDS